MCYNVLHQDLWTKIMKSPSPTLSLRVPTSVRKRLDRASAKMRRSRSWIVLQALEEHLDKVERKEKATPKKPYSTLLSLAGAGAARNGPRAAEEILAYSRRLRDND